MPDLVRIEDLSFRYAEGRRPAVSHFSTTIREGEVMILAGPSGCGKSTLLRSINGLVPHMYSGEYTGEVYVEDEVVAFTSMSRLAQKVGLLFQNPENQIFMFSVERDIAFGLENLGLPSTEIRRRVDDAMHQLGIAELANRAPHELSDGQKQRVALAGVMAMRPKLVILDEPTSLLDPKTATELVALVKRLRDETNMTFVVVEHRLDLLAKVASRIVVMSQGTKVVDGGLSKVLSEHELARYGVAVPTAPRLKAELVEKGVLPGGKVPDPEELADELNSVIR